MGGPRRLLGALAAAAALGSDGAAAHEVRPAAIDAAPTTTGPARLGVALDGEASPVGAVLGAGRSPDRQGPA